MKLFTNIKRSGRKGMMLASLAVALLGVGIISTVTEANVARDCDANAVMYCGALTTAEVNQKYDANPSTRDIFNYFGISGTEVNNLHTTAVTGTVTKSGNVIVDGKVVATNAITAGRQNMPGSTQVSHGGTTFYTRPPSVSFVPPSLEAFVVVKNGVFQFAILKACGNPVKATPREEPKPNYAIEKTVSHYGRADYANTISVKSGESVMYRIEVKSTGAVAARNINVKDKLPPNVHLEGSVTRDGNVVNAHEFFNGGGVVIPSLAPGTSTIFKFKAKIGVNDTPTSCNPANLNNVGKMTAPDLPAREDNAAVNKSCGPPPVSANLNFTCDRIFGKAAGLQGKWFRIFHDAAGDGVLDNDILPNASNGAGGVAVDGNGRLDSNGDYANYINGAALFGNGTVSKQFVLRIYDNANYNVLITQEIVNGQLNCVPPEEVCVPPTTGTPPNCMPPAVCTGLSLVAGGNRSVTATATYAPASAVIKSASYDFGDGTAPVVNTLPTASHTYDKEGNYVVKATFVFTQNGVDQNAVCQAPVTFGPAPVYTCDAFDISVNKTDRTVSATNFATTATNGATFTKAVINWGDSSAPTETPTVIGQKHQYAADGNYSIVVTAHFTVNIPGTETDLAAPAPVEVTASSAACQKAVSFTTTEVCIPPTTGTPPDCSKPCVPETPGGPMPPHCVTTAAAPTTLVSTGAGSIAGLVTAIVAVAAYLHRRALSRRLSDLS